MTRKIFLLFFCVLAACGKKTFEGSRKPLLLVSLAPYQTLVQTIAGEEFEVRTVVPIGADPHNYEPTAQQLTQISQGKIWFRIGEPFEAKLLPCLKTTNLVDLRDALPLIEGQCQSHNHQDRHLWLSPKLLTIQAERITAALSEMFPENQKKFEERLYLIICDLKTLDLEIENQLRSAKVRTFLVSHPAFAYFCRDYDCRQLSIEHEGKDPRPKELENTLRLAKEHQVMLSITLPQYNNKGAQLIAENLQIPVRMIDPYAADYLNTMKKLAELISTPLNDERD